MNIAISGHTKGIGNACCKLLEKSHQIIGLSRETGFDINDRPRVISAIKDADVFINNAYAGYSQAYLLHELLAIWQHERKIIINIGSSCTRYRRAEQHLDHLPWEYRDHKMALDSVFRTSINLTPVCSVHLLSPGPVDTDMVKHVNCKKLKPDAVAEAAQLMIRTPSIIELVLYAK